MSKRWRRYEVLLPVTFNDGKPVPRKWFGNALLEIVDRFGAASFQPHPIGGIWRHQGVVYPYRSKKIIVDVPDTTDSRRWMREYKKRWKEQLQQLELWMVSYRIDVE